MSPATTSEGWCLLSTIRDPAIAQETPSCRGHTTSYASSIAPVRLEASRPMTGHTVRSWSQQHERLSKHCKCQSVTSLAGTC